MEKRSDHHQLAQSLGGSHHEENRILIPHELHNGWHEWTGNLAPTTVARFMLLMSIGWEDGSINPDFLKYFFDKTDIDVLDKLYRPETLISGTELQAIEKAKTAAIHTINHLQVEIDVVKNIQEALKGNSPFPSQVFSRFAKSFLEFFGTESPAVALEELFTHRREGKLVWVNPLKESVRESIILTMWEAEETGDLWVPSAKKTNALYAALDVHHSALKKREEQRRTEYERTTHAEPETYMPCILRDMQRKLAETSGIGAIVA